MSPISKLPSLDWTERAEKQILLTGGDELIAASQVAYRLGNAGVIGLIYTSYFSPPWLWFALAKTTRIRDLIDFRRTQDRIPRGTLTAVDEDDATAYRFATFYGFEQTGQTVDHEGILMLIMRKA